MYYGDLRANSGKVSHSRAHWCWERLMISVHYGWLLNQWPPEYWPTSRSEAVEHCSVFCQEQKELCKIKWAPGWTAVTASSGLNGLRFDRTDWVIQKRKSAGCFGKKGETLMISSANSSWDLQYYLGISLGLITAQLIHLYSTYYYYFFFSTFFKMILYSYTSRWRQLAWSYERFVQNCWFIQGGIKWVML